MGKRALNKWREQKVALFSSVRRPSWCSHLSGFVLTRSHLNNTTSSKTTDEGRGAMTGTMTGKANVANKPTKNQVGKYV